jgi:hypothetical protein
LFGVRLPVSGSCFGFVDFVWGSTRNKSPKQVVSGYPRTLYYRIMSRLLRFASNLALTFVLAQKGDYSLAQIFVLAQKGDYSLAFSK